MRQGLPDSEGPGEERGRVPGEGPRAPARGGDRLGGAEWPDAPPVTRLGPLVWISGVLMVTIGIVTSILLLRGFESDSYLYLAFYSIPANTAISVFPHEPVLIYFGKVANLWLTAIWATAGTAVAAVMDWIVFVPVLNHENIRGYKDKAYYRKAIGYFMKWPFATLLVTGFTPIPFFPFKFLCFSVGYPMWKYTTALLVARFPRYYLYALLGALIPIPNWILIASVAVIFALYGIKAVPAGLERWKAWRQARRASR